MKIYPFRGSPEIFQKTLSISMSLKRSQVTSLGAKDNEL